MKFLGGFLKFLSILIMLVATIICTFIAVDADVPEAYWAMGFAWICALLVDMCIFGIGHALTELRKTNLRIDKLENKLQALTSGTVPHTSPEVFQNNISGEHDGTFYKQTEDTPQPPKKKNKFLIPAAILGVLAVVIIGSVILFGDKPQETEAAQETTTEEAKPETCAMDIHSICVDDSFEDKDGDPIKVVYLFYSVKAEDTNLDIDSKYTKMYIGSNVYESDNFADNAKVSKFVKNYYYGSYIQDVYVGDSKNVIATFYVPVAEMEGDKEVTFEDYQIPGIDQIKMSTNDFVHFDTPEDIAMHMDPKGYEEILYARESADDDLTKKVRSMLNDYRWDFYVNNTAYAIEFWSKNNFSVSTGLGTQSGKYSVRNGYIFCTYDSNDYTVEIPYEIVDGKIDLDVVEGFDVR